MQLRYNYNSQNNGSQPTEEDLIRIQERIDKLKTSRFKQQVHSAFKPVPTYGSAALTTFIFAVFFLTPGIVLFTYSDLIRGVTYDYDDCGAIGDHCTLDIHIE